MRLLLKNVNILIILMIHISRDTFVQSNEDSKSPDLVAIIHRHGDRTPTRTYENDPYKDEQKYWPIGLGQLTKKGKRQLYYLGKIFRKRYKKFISKYLSKSVRVNSSDYDRTHMSAAVLLAGLFPPETDQIWSHQLIWQPIAIHSVPITKDKVIALQAPCPKYILELDRVLAELASHETLEDKALYNYLTENTGQNISTLRDVEILHDTLLIEERNGLPLPTWTRKVYPTLTREKAILSAISFTWNDVLKRFFGGPLIKDILWQFNEKSEGHLKDMKLLLYSGHDSTILSVMRALDFKGFLMPDFGASLIFELHKLNDKYHVKIFYMHNAEVEPTELEIPNCTTHCTLDKFLNITEYVRSVDWDTQC
ncbi:prostatic acid phosphatase-like isoform X2 [Lycorma delicatula]|uniref:prostatic acid phosphatase-like isoform X2 n=1 Tax=Lycorma delicatula TaxID=130591 RepID=UPI003F514377